MTTTGVIMGHYKSNLRDLEFNLFEVFGRAGILGDGPDSSPRRPYPDIDLATARQILAEADRLAREDLAASLLESDQTPPVFDPKAASVTLPGPFTSSFRALENSGFARLGLPVELGGGPCPPSLRWAVAELVLGANPAAFMYAAGPRFASIIWQEGTEPQRAFAQRMADRGWAATMMLTEPDAGSDVGAGRTSATRQPDGTWHLEGVKRFITAAEHDLTENIVHLVLARPAGAGPGTKGLSLFIVPKFLVDERTGELGERNGVYVTGVEHKMGLKVSTTCEVTFGARQPAVGMLLGEVHDGIRQMFRIIEYARMMVGTKAIATLSSGYLTALDYARTRVQGADLTRMSDKSAPRVTITHHPDVRRLLMFQKSYAEGMRALVLYTATVQDQIEIAAAAGGRDEPAEHRNDLLLPIVKGYGSERSYEQLTGALQTLGGSGYLRDYPIEQYIRDAKIDSLYEGTTAIQGLDLFFRKIIRDRGAALTALVSEIAEFAKSEQGGPALAAERELLGRAVEDVRGILASMVSALGAAAERPREVYRVGQNTTRLLFAAGDLICGWLLLRQAAVARAALADGTPEHARDEAFYQGKVAAARFFARNVLPHLAAERAIAESVDNALMDLPEAAF
jgi:alkylation response protein AidB-like acyl-CoA dehydrogenase